MEKDRRVDCGREHRNR